MLRLIRHPVMFLFLLVPCPAMAAGQLHLASPDSNIEFLLTTGPEGLHYTVMFKGKYVIEPSAIVFTIDGNDITSSARIDSVEYYQINTRYAYRGLHSQAINHCNGARIGLIADRARSVLEVRVFNDGVAFRHIFADDQQPHIPDELTRFVLPPKATVWYHDLTGHYEGEYDCNQVGQVKSGQWIAPPMTAVLPELGYAAITEAALANYSGMALQADGNGGFTLVLGHKHPISYPYKLRYSQQDIEQVSQPARITGTITTPWRVVIISQDLNGLVNSDIIPNLCPEPDKELFPDGIQTSWIRPGRAVWRYLDGGEATLEGAKEFCRLAGQLGFEYNVIEGYWSGWTDEQIRELVEYAREYGVGLWVWRHSRQLRQEQQASEFFARLRQLGVKGAKIDFFDHEHKQVIDLYQSLLKQAAKNQILVNFHGANKPSGEPRTWPNELVREAVRGMEARSLKDRARHDVILPFTRYIAGHADYTPVHFGQRRGNTTIAHQIATAVVFTSPLLTYAAHPSSILDNPAVDLIKAIPAVWDRTIVLDCSQIGQLAAFARQGGNRWFIGVLNGPDARQVKVDLGFLGTGEYEALIASDTEDTDGLDVARKTVRRDQSITISLVPGGGYVAMFSR